MDIVPFMLVIVHIYQFYLFLILTYMYLFTLAIKPETYSNDVHLLKPIVNIVDSFHNNFPGLKLEHINRQMRTQLLTWKRQSFLLNLYIKDAAFPVSVTINT